MTVDEVLTALGFAELPYATLDIDEWVSSCPNCGLPKGLRIREVNPRKAELICGASCNRDRVEESLGRFGPLQQIPKRQLASSTQPQLTSLRSIPSVEYVEVFTGRVAHHNRIKCPFHNAGRERWPALRVKDQDGGWYCYVCNVGGGVLEFYARLRGREVPGDPREFAKFVDEVARALTLGWGIHLDDPICGTLWKQNEIAPAPLERPGA